MFQGGNTNRVAAFVDGFNIYHFLNNSNLKKYKWLDYRKLCSCFLPRNSTLVSVQYFTARATWDQKKVLRHDIYIRALRYAGIDIVVGRFKRLKKKVVLKNEASYKNYTTSDGNIPGSIFYGYTFEEKKTDVNIACSIISKATNNEYDTALLLSGDTDFEPAISTVQQLFKKDIIVAVPNKKIAGSIKSIVPKGHCVTIREKDLACSLLPDPIKLPDGKIITCPLEWHL